MAEMLSTEEGGAVYFEQVVSQLGKEHSGLIASWYDTLDPTILLGLSRYYTLSLLIALTRSVLKPLHLLIPYRMINEIFGYRESYGSNWSFLQIPMPPQNFAQVLKFYVSKRIIGRVNIIPY
jgi:hypothetical protein